MKRLSLFILLILVAFIGTGFAQLHRMTGYDLDSIVVRNTMRILGATIQTGDFTVLGKTTLGNATGDDIQLNGYIATSILPKTTGLYNLGSAVKSWGSAWIDSVLTALNIVVDGRITQHGTNTSFINLTADTVTAGSSNAIFNIGTLATPQSRDIDSSYIPLVVNVASTTAPVNPISLIAGYYRAAATTTDQPQTQLVGLAARTTLSKDVRDAYGIQSHTTIANNADAAGGNITAISGKTVLQWAPTGSIPTAGLFTIEGAFHPTNCYGVWIDIVDATVSAGLEINTTGGTMESAIKIDNSAGTITNDLQLHHGATITDGVEKVTLAVADTFQATYFKGALVGNAATATTATNATNGATIAVATDAEYFPSFFASASNGNQPFNLDASGFTFNPSKNRASVDSVHATRFYGALYGNATTATNAADVDTNGTKIGAALDDRVSAFVGHYHFANPTPLRARFYVAGMTAHLPMFVSSMLGNAECPPLILPQVATVVDSVVFKICAGDSAAWTGDSVFFFVVKP
jgi:hypothetical protein